MAYNYQRSATRIKGVEVNQSETGISDLILPVDTMNVMAEPYVPQDGTLQRDYDGHGWFESPTFRLTLELEWDYERTEMRPETFDTLGDVLAYYMDGYAFDFYVKYEQGSYDDNYICPYMIPDIQNDSAGISFTNRAREKDRSILLESQSSTLTWPEVSFTYD